MAFSIVCTNKGCGKQQEPYLDPTDNKVYCSSCDQEIVGITHFAKAQMKSLKQFRVKKTQSFSVKCNNCKKEDRPIILNNEVVCSSCKDKLNHLSITFKNMLKEQLKKVDKE